MEVLRAVGQREEELRRQIAMMKATVEKLGGAVMLTARTQAFWGQPFSEEIDETPIPLNFREVVVEPFDGTKRTTKLQAVPGYPVRCGHALVSHYPASLHKFATNRVKRLEVVDLFVIRQAKGETLKSYLPRFNNATVWVNDLDQKFFVKAFQKGLRAGLFNDSLAVRRP
ncbi:hypothetical protein CR513_38519, partial [Mucuna pruriens]